MWCSFEVRSPIELLREAEGDIPRSPNTYEITPNPLWNASPLKDTELAQLHDAWKWTPTNASPEPELLEASFDEVSEPAELPADQESGNTTQVTLRPSCSPFLA